MTKAPARTRLARAWGLGSGGSVTSLCGEARDLNGVFLQFYQVPVRLEGDSVAGKVEVVGAEGAVPVREVVADARKDTRGEVWGERVEEKVRFLGILGEVGAVLQ